MEDVEEFNGELANGSSVELPMYKRDFELGPGIDTDRRNSVPKNEGPRRSVAELTDDFEVHLDDNDEIGVSEASFYEETTRANLSLDEHSRSSLCSSLDRWLEQEEIVIVFGTDSEDDEDVTPLKGRSLPNGTHVERKQGNELEEILESFFDDHFKENVCYNENTSGGREDHVGVKDNVVHEVGNDSTLTSDAVKKIEIKSTETVNIPVSNSCTSPLKQPSEVLHENSRLFSCTICNKCFSSNRSVTNHKNRVHTGKALDFSKISSLRNDLNDYHCGKCGKGFVYPCNLNKHVTTCKRKSYTSRDSTQMLPDTPSKTGVPPAGTPDSVQSSGSSSQVRNKFNFTRRPHRCGICGAGYHSLWNLEAHMRYHVLNDKWGCKICNIFFINETCLRIHMMKLHKEIMRPYICPRCSTQCVSAELLKHHVCIELTGSKTENQSLLKPKIKCEYCSTEFQFQQQLDDHRVFKNVVKVQCLGLLCSTFYDTYLTLQKHVCKAAHTMSSKCSTCYKHFNSRMELASHIMCKPVAGDETLPSCSYSPFSNPSQHHAGSHLVDDTLYRCPSCSQCFTNQAERDDHIVERKHSTPFNCAFCKKTYITEIMLEKHLLTHQVVAPFQCAVYAQRRHIKEKLFKRVLVQCVKCNLTFNTGSDSRSHTCLKPSTCMLCLQVFTLPSELAQHLLTHTHHSVKPQTMTPQSVHRVSNSAEHDEKSKGVPLLLVQCHVCNEAHSPTRTKHPNFGNDLKCPKCATLLPTRCSLNVHLRSHAIQQECAHCQQTFHSEQSFSSHVMPQVATCRTCGLSAETACAMTQHVRSNCTRAYTCGACGGIFEKLQAFRTHGEARRFDDVIECLFCGETCATQCSFAVHLRGHAHMNKKH